MSDVIINVEDDDSDSKDSSPKKKNHKPKKRPSDFEIVKTILQKTNERKLGVLLRNMGEDADLLFICSENEDGFLYGSSSLSCAILKIDDPELQDIFKTVLSKIHGFSSDRQLVINLRDQMSALSKTKGENIPDEVSTNSDGAVWLTKTDVNGNSRTVNYATLVESLFHFEDVKKWCSLYKRFLTENVEGSYVYKYESRDGITSDIITIPPDTSGSDIFSLYPDGFRVCVTRGIDVLITKTFEPHFPFPVVEQELIFFVKDGVVAQMVCRLIGVGWSMVLVRPNNVIFPMSKNSINKLKYGGL